jgi:hypothetical protein
VEGDWRGVIKNRPCVGVATEGDEAGGAGRELGRQGWARRREPTRWLRGLFKRARGRGQARWVNKARLAWGGVRGWKKNYTKWELGDVRSIIFWGNRVCRIKMGPQNPRQASLKHTLCLLLAGMSW